MATPLRLVPRSHKDSPMAETQQHGGGKRRKTTSSKHGRQWAELPADVLLSVAYAASYPSASLYAAVGHVCTRWRAAIASAMPPGTFPCRLPLLALQQLPATSRRGYTNGFPEDLRRHLGYGMPRVVESDISGAVGSSHGWLVVLDPDAAHLAVRNPATRHAIHFPSLLPLIDITTSSSAQAPHVDVHRVIVSHDPALHKDFVVLLFVAGVTTRCFTFRQGANAWAAHAHREFHVEDVVFFSGRFVAVDKENNLGVFEWRENDHLAMTTRRLEPRTQHPRRTPVSSDESVFLVDLSGSLLVATVWCVCDRSLPAQQIPQEVLEVDFSEDSGADGAVLVAKERQNLGGHAVFLGHGNSVAVAGAHFPELGTDVIFCPIRSRKKIQGAILISPYNLLVVDNRGIIVPVEFCKARERTEPAADVWSGPLRPLWVVPNLLGVESRKKKKRILTAFSDIYI